MAKVADNDQVSLIGLAQNFATALTGNGVEHAAVTLHSDTELFAMYKSGDMDALLSSNMDELFAQAVWHIAHKTPVIPEMRVVEHSNVDCVRAWLGGRPALAEKSYQAYEAILMAHEKLGLEPIAFR